MTSSVAIKFLGLGLLLHVYSFKLTSQQILSDVFDLAVENSLRLNFHGGHVSVFPMKSKPGV